jgi:FecR protein
MLRIVRISVWLLVLLAVVPGRGLGQPAKAGIATIIEGDVTARRAAAPKPVTLKFRDDVLLRDTITTAERSLARLLLGGKATVTVRERSQLTVTEIPGTSLVDLGTGKIGLALAPGRMRPGDVVQVRTPNAVLGVRGTVLVAEIVPVTAKTARAAPSIQTSVYVLTGKVDVQELRGGVPVGPVFTVNSRQTITIPPPASPQVTAFPESRIAAITAGLHPSTRGVGSSGATAKEAALRAAAKDLSEGLADGETRLPGDEQTVRAPIGPVLPALPESSAPPPAVQGPAPTRSPGQIAPPSTAAPPTAGKGR